MNPEINKIVIEAEFADLVDALLQRKDLLQIKHQIIYYLCSKGEKE